MLPAIINPISLLFTLTAGFGVLVHDMKIDKATTTALAIPAAFITYGLADAGLKSDGHTHVERASVSENLRSLSQPQPKIQPRNNDDKGYISVKKMQGGGFDSDYIWPSV